MFIEEEASRQLRRVLKHDEHMALSRRAYSERYPFTVCCLPAYRRPPETLSADRLIMARAVL